MLKLHKYLLLCNLLNCFIQVYQLIIYCTINEKKCRCQTLIQTEYYNIQYDDKPHCSWSTINKHEWFLLQSLHCFRIHPYKHALISSHMHSLLYITEDKTTDVCCLYTKIQIRKYDSCFWSKPREGQKPRCRNRILSEEHRRWLWRRFCVLIFHTGWQGIRRGFVGDPLNDSL